MLIRLTLAAALLATPALAADKKEDACRYEAQVMAAVQKARLDRMAKGKVEGHIVASGPTWPEKYSAAIPQMVEYIYQKEKDKNGKETNKYVLSRRYLKKNDFGAIWEQQCLQTWEQRQEMLKAMQN